MTPPTVPLARKLGAAILLALVVAGCSWVVDLDGLAGGGLGDAGDGGPINPEGGEVVPDGVAPDADVPDSGCRGSAGPSQIRVGAYCIDTTEVTAAQYSAFVTAMGKNTGGQPPECAFNTSFAPKETVVPDSLPARHVDWCDAFAYCKWAGKHLCGAIGGGAGSYDQPALLNHEWFAACSAGGTRLYPYGNAYDSAACNGLDINPEGEAIPVATKPRCIGADDRLFDMSGNVREWQQVCQPGTGIGTETCLTAGGGANDLATELRCSDTHTDARSYTSEHVGFRCCSE